MPKVANFRKGSIIYFKGEKPDSIYLIKAGEVSIKLEKADDTPVKLLRKGEFFGLYSAIGQYPRQEDAVSVTDVELLLFDETEFEQLIAQNSRFSLQLMKMLSKELRRIHKLSSSLMNKENAFIDPGTGMFSYIELYLKTKDKEKAKYVINRFLEIYPNHEKAAEVKNIQTELG